MDIKIWDQELHYGDVKYYYQLHLNRMKAQYKIPVSYPTFLRRITKYNMSLYDAIYTPWTLRPHRKTKTPYLDNIRRTQLLKAEKVPVVDFSVFDRYERHQRNIDRGYTEHKKVLLKEIERQTKPSLIDRFISFFKR